MLKEQLLNKIKGKTPLSSQNGERKNMKRNQSGNEVDNKENNMDSSEMSKKIFHVSILEADESKQQSIPEFVIPPIKTSWTIPTTILKKNSLSFEALRQEMNVTVTGENIPPIIPRFTQMHLPKYILEEFKEKGIQKPTSIQMQCLPAVFMGRDVIGIASHSKGKSLIGLLSLFLFALEEEMKLPLTYEEGPIGVLLSSSKENAVYLYNKLQKWNRMLEKNDLPRIRIMLCIGGESFSDQVKKFREGCHIIVATPGRFNNHLQKRTLSLNICKIICLDDGEKLLTEDIEVEIKSILNEFHHPKQIVLFSTSFPKPFIGFARDFMHNPIIVNAGEREIKRTDIEHNVQFLFDQERTVFLVKKCLNLTPPPVIIFTHVLKNINEIEEYLLLKGLDVASITPQMSHEEEKKVIHDLKEKKIDIVIMSDYSKHTIHLPDVNHVINYDIPSDFSLFLKRLNYVKENGIATTFVTSNTPEIAMRELKYFLLKTKQKIPECMKSLKKERDIVVEKGNACLWCGRPGHSILNCPKV